jgi:hypothetical protein
MELHWQLYLYFTPKEDSPCTHPRWNPSLWACPCNNTVGGWWQSILLLLVCLMYTILWWVSHICEAYEWRCVQYVWQCSKMSDLRKQIVCIKFCFKLVKLFLKHMTCYIVRRRCFIKSTGSFQDSQIDKLLGISGLWTAICKHYRWKCWKGSSGQTSYCSWYVGENIFCFLIYMLI